MRVMGGLGFLDPIKVALKCASIWEIMMSLESVSLLVVVAVGPQYASVWQTIQVQISNHELASSLL